MFYNAPMKFLLLFISLNLLVLVSFAQNEEEPQVPSRIETMSGKIYGKLVDNTGKPIEAASVLLYSVKGDSLISGIFSKSNGDFSFSNLPPAISAFLIVISAVGFEKIERKVETTNKENNQQAFQKDLGNIELVSSIKQLSNVTVSVSKPALHLGIDRKIFSVDKSLTATGGTAVDVMRNIPLVSVDIDGNVELRNSAPQIFVDGRPTILTLDQIPADHIDKIELITNPSAKFDAASSAGIINIILKKNKRVGLNGLVSVSGGVPSLFSSNLNLNFRQGKFNVFANGGYNQSGGEATGKTARQNKQNGVITDYFNQYSLNRRSRKFSSVRIGTDYFIDNRNTVTVSQNFVRGRFGDDETQHQEYLDELEQLQYYGLRESDGRSRFDRKETRVGYKHNFPKEEKELTADVTYNYGTRSSDANIFNSYFYPDGSVYQPPAIVRNEGSTGDKELTMQADYTDPVGLHAKIEAGIRSYIHHSDNRYDAFTVSNGQESKLPLGNNYQYREMVNAAYATYSNKNKKENFSYQLGLRAEFSKFEGDMIDSSFKFGYNYPGSLENIWKSLFPSFFLSQKISEDDEIQFNYTRRIRRPRFWQLNPFIDITDPVNLRQGNPQLKPEFVNSFEFNYSKNYKRGNFLSTLYFRNNPEDITEYSDTISAAQYQQLNNAAIDPNAILNTYVNASTTNRYGIEFTLQHKIADIFDLVPSLNLQYRTTKANINSLSLSNKGFNWEGQMTMNYKIATKASSFFNNFSLQFSADYESPQVIPQGKRIAEFDADFAIRKDFLKDKKATFTFAINDVFNTRKWGTIYDTDQFYQDSYRRWNVRNFRLTFTYKFGDPNFTLKKRSGDRENNDE